MKAIRLFVVVLFYFGCSSAYSSDICEQETMISPKQKISVIHNQDFYKTVPLNYVVNTDFYIWVRKCRYLKNRNKYQLVALAIATEDKSHLSIGGQTQVLSKTIQNELEQTVLLPNIENQFTPEKEEVIGDSGTYILSEYVDYSKPFKLILSCPTSQTNQELWTCKIDGQLTQMLHFNSDDAAPTTETNMALKVSGSWYDPALNGLGFAIEQTPNGTMMYYYGYKANQNGKPLWLISGIIDKEISKNITYSTPMYSPQDGNGASFNRKPYVDSGVKAWGNLTFSFTACNSGIATLSGNDGTQTFNLSRLSTIDGVTCSD